MKCLSSIRASRRVIALICTVLSLAFLAPAVAETTEGHREHTDGQGGPVIVAGILAGVVFLVVFHVWRDRNITRERRRKKQEQQSEHSLDKKLSDRTAIVLDLAPHNLSELRPSKANEHDSFAVVGAQVGFKMTF